MNLFFNTYPVLHMSCVHPSHLPFICQQPRGSGPSASAGRLQAAGSRADCGGHLRREREDQVMLIGAEWQNRGGGSTVVAVQGGGVSTHISAESRRIR